ncbi:MAG: LysM peptidoglycan-binding domain-containing protein [Stomatobaculum sp.]|nr:LysM peptidoglycan-binding domain-containing protein [Stomatobaculum sp.]
MNRAEKVFRSLVLTALLLVVFVLFAENRLIVAQAGERSIPAGCCFTSVKISEQDTLESFADRYNTDLYDSNDTYISTVRKMNGMHGDKLYPGCYLNVICRLP